MKSHGFTLVEILVVVAIVAILMAIALPAYNKYVYRGRQIEAKSMLTKLYTAEKLFATETGSYTLCLSQIGVPTAAQPGTDQDPNRHYAVGFNTSLLTTAQSCGYNGLPATDGTQPCNAYDWGPMGGPASTAGNTCVTTDMYSAGIRKENSAIAVPDNTNLRLVDSDITMSTFLAAASGNVSARSAYDRWTINDGKVLVNSDPNAW
jgi:type IV pilus assembly protein PilE